MATYIKSTTVEAVPKKKKGKAGYEVIVAGKKTWHAKSAFEHD